MKTNENNKLKVMHAIRRAQAQNIFFGSLAPPKNTQPPLKKDAKKAGSLF